jgi:hypothetical protein
VGTSPFLLMNLIWLALLPLFTQKHSDQLLVLGCEKQNRGASVVLTLCETGSSADLTIGGEAEAVAETLGATLYLNNDKKRLTIEIPVKPLECFNALT